MTDLEITRLCADAMELECVLNLNMDLHYWPSWHNTSERYDPLQDDAQAMALVKKFRLRISQPVNTSRGWLVHVRNSNGVVAGNLDLNRAVCECVAEMQQAKS